MHLMSAGDRFKVLVWIYTKCKNNYIYETGGIWKHDFACYWYFYNDKLLWCSYYVIESCRASVRCLTGGILLLFNIEPGDGEVTGLTSEGPEFEPLSCCQITPGGLTQPVSLLWSAKWVQGDWKQGALHQWNSCTPSNDVTRSHRLHTKLLELNIYFSP